MAVRHGGREGMAGRGLWGGTYNRPEEWGFDRGVRKGESSIYSKGSRRTGLRSAQFVTGSTVAGRGCARVCTHNRAAQLEFRVWRAAGDEKENGTRLPKCDGSVISSYSAPERLRSLTCPARLSACTALLLRDFFWAGRRGAKQHACRVCVKPARKPHRIISSASSSSTSLPSEPHASNGPHQALLSI